MRGSGEDASNDAFISFAVKGHTYDYLNTFTRQIRLTSQSAQSMGPNTPLNAMILTRLAPKEEPYLHRRVLY